MAQYYLIFCSVMPSSDEKIVRIYHCINCSVELRPHGQKKNILITLLCVVGKNSVAQYTKFRLCTLRKK